MALLFQPRWSGYQPRHATTPPCSALAAHRGATFLAALEAAVLGDATRFASVFTDDVVFSSPHLHIESVVALQRAIGDPEESLTDVEVVVLTLASMGERVVAEWRLEGRFTRPVLFDDRLLIEPTGGEVQLPGAAFAEFREDRICAFRHYFDDSELLAGVAGISTHLRWIGDR